MADSTFLETGRGKIKKTPYPEVRSHGLPLHVGGFFRMPYHLQSVHLEHRQRTVVWVKRQLIFWHFPKCERLFGQIPEGPWCLWHNSAYYSTYSFKDILKKNRIYTVLLIWQQPHSVIHYMVSVQIPTMFFLYFSMFYWALIKFSNNVMWDHAIFKKKTG